ncbi:MAG: DMT family transporter [Leptolyngbyaceae cyanobacterium CRU_2_3]|nr:DMT family transporter [Leptolyngbyaceae cyanobacterium CRU_2_3]
MSSPKPSNWQVVAVLGVGVVCVSTAAILIRLAFAAANAQGVGFSLVLAASRLAIAALCLAPAWGNLRKERFQLSALCYSAAAGVCLALHFACWITSLSYTSIAASATLVTTNPVWVALLSWLWFREKPGSTTVLGIAITLLGGMLVAIGSAEATFAGSNPLLGNFLALVGSWAVSLYFLLGREAQRRGLDVGSHVVLTYTTAAGVLLPLPALFGASYSGYHSSVYLWILLMALFPQLIGHTSFNWAVRWISPTLVTLTILAEPVGSSILGAIVFRENPGSTVLLGAAVILTGVATAALGAQGVGAQVLKEDEDKKP